MFQRIEADFLKREAKRLEKKRLEKEENKENTPREKKTEEEEIKKYYNFNCKTKRITRFDQISLVIPPSTLNVVKCEKGEIVIFRQDLVHQGLGYEKTNLRYFMYIDLIGKNFYLDF